MSSSVKQILSEITDRLLDTAASLDALEVQLVESGVLTKDAIRNRFQTHKAIVEIHLSSVRSLIASLPETE